MVASGKREGNMLISARKRLSVLAWPKYSMVVDMVNQNPRMMAWLDQHGNVPKYTERHDYFSFVHGLVNRPIDYLEFGVWKGASVKWWSEANTHPESRFVGFDSFGGLTEPMKWAVGGTAPGHLSVHGAVPKFDDKRIRMVKGYFQDTLDDFLDSFRPQNTLVIHLDADLYSSTLYALAKLDRLIGNGAIVMFDEFPSALQEYRAFTDYVSSFNRKYRLLATCAYRFAFAMGKSEEVIEELLSPKRDDAQKVNH
jgi:O-methyltransferase